MGFEAQSELSQVPSRCQWLKSTNRTMVKR
jgi:hypothetical protein